MLTAALGRCHMIAPARLVAKLRGLRRTRRPVSTWEPVDLCAALHALADHLEGLRAVDAARVARAAADHMHDCDTASELSRIITGGPWETK